MPPHVILLQRAGAAPQALALGGGATAGSGPADGVAIPELGPGALVLTPTPHGVVASLRGTAARLGARALAPGTRRLVRAGERLEIARVALAVEASDAAEAPERTRHLAAALLAGAEAGEPPVPAPRLVVVEGPDAGLALALRDGVLGRGDGAALRLSDVRASRAHAAVAVGPGGPAVRDLGSKNGLAVNGRRVRGTSPLSPGDLVALGETLLAYDAGEHAGGGPAPAPREAGRGARRAAVAAAVALAAAAALCLAAL